MINLSVASTVYQINLSTCARMVVEKATQKHPRRWWRLLLIVFGIIIVALWGRPTLHLLWTAWQDADNRQPLPPGFVDDASHMNACKVAEIWSIPSDVDTAEKQLAKLLQHAREEGLRVSIAGARHSMGGHTIYPGGIVIDMLPFQDMQFDEQKNILRVQAGALWKDIIAYLDARDRSVAIMQSNNSFSVGGSISVNCHGWQYGRPPIASTVESFRLMKADGTIVRCSRDENAELFSLVLGGYGLLGIILDVDLHVVPNERYRLEQTVIPVDQALVAFESQITTKSDPEMVYARIGIVPDQFLQDVIINALYRDPAANGAMPALSEPRMANLRRSMFRGSVGSDYGKHLRWEAETKLQPHLNKTYFSRNQLLNESVEVFQNRSDKSTDILHEYFVPRESIASFLHQLRRIIPAHQGDLLNVTVRYVDTDTDTLLRYADQPMFAFVLLFNQPTTAAGNAQMQAMTQEMIDAVLTAGGRFYLPYRLHATPKQFRMAYPQADEFFALKRKYDPDELFQNQFYRRYSMKHE